MPKKQYVQRFKIVFTAEFRQNSNGLIKNFKRECQSKNVNSDTCDMLNIKADEVYFLMYGNK